MLFNSYIFIFFLVITLFLYFLLNYFHNETAAKVVLVGASLCFYSYFRLSYLFIIIASILFNYVFSYFLRLKGNYRLYHKVLLAFGILGNVALIFYFKYMNFLLENTNILLGQSFTVKNILMPLGISFFTFQQISYLVDSYKGETSDYCFLDYILYVTFFPQLIAGPIVLHDEMIPQFQDPSKKRIQLDNLAKGIWWFAIGLSKKVLLADTLGVGADWGFSHPEQLSGIDTVLVSLLYTFQIYFDFSGYCDMASGIASMFNFTLPVNFNSPYKAVSIIEFWQRWHMTLTRFLRKYVYIPLGGSRCGKVRAWMNILIVFLISGIWHGANWTFVVWGILNGIANVINRIFKKEWEKFPRALRWITNFLFVNMLWIIFRADSLSDSRIMFRNMFSKWETGIHSELVKCFNILEFTYLEEHISLLGRLPERIYGLHIWILLIVSLGIILFCKNCYEKNFRPTLKNGMGSIVLLVWSILSFSGLSTFLYFNF